MGENMRMQTAGISCLQSFLVAGLIRACITHFARPILLECEARFCNSSVVNVELVLVGVVLVVAVMGENHLIILETGAAGRTEGSGEGN